MGVGYSPRLRERPALHLTIGRSFLLLKNHCIIFISEMLCHMLLNIVAFPEFALMWYQALSQKC